MDRMSDADFDALVKVEEKSYGSGALLREAIRARAAERANSAEAQRLRCGEGVEGDFVCPHEFRAKELEAERDEARSRSLRSQRFDEMQRERDAAIARAEAAEARERDGWHEAHEFEKERDAALAQVERLRKALEALVSYSDSAVPSSADRFDPIMRSARAALVATESKP